VTFQDLKDKKSPPALPEVLLYFFHFNPKINASRCSDFLKLNRIAGVVGINFQNLTDSQMLMIHLITNCKLLKNKINRRTKTTINERNQRNKKVLHGVFPKK